MRLSNVFPKGIKKRLILLFFIFTLLFSVLLSGSALLLLHQAEKQLQSIDMGLAIERIRKQYLNGEDVGRADRFFHGQQHSSAFPFWLRDLPAGFYKVRRDHLIWHVMVADFPDQRYILLRDYTVFESNRLHPLWLLVIVSVSSLLLSSILVWITLFYVIHPIERLEKNIRENLSPHDLSSSMHDPLAQHYADHEIGQLARSFDLVYQELHQALQRERLFTADVSHELRTPLMVILSSCELLLATRPFSSKEQQRLSNIQHSAEQILQRLHVYFALARQNSSIVDQFKQSNIVEIAKTVMAENESFAARYQTHLTLQIHDSDRLYPTDFCHSVLSNLVKNAIEYAGENTTVAITILKHGFSVSDDGIGITSEQQPLIFDTFQRLNHASEQHLGLGLSLVQRICQYMQWQIKFSSQPKHGTTFTIFTDKN